MLLKSSFDIENNINAFDKLFGLTVNFICDNNYFEKFESFYNLRFLEWWKG